MLIFSTDYANTFRIDMNFECGNNGWINGLYSFHDSEREEDGEFGGKERKDFVLQ